MERCFTFQWGLFSRWGASFLSGGGGVCPMRGIGFDGGGFKNIDGWGSPPMPHPLWGTLPDKPLEEIDKESSGSEENVESSDSDENVEKMT